MSGGGRYRIMEHPMIPVLIYPIYLLLRHIINLLTGLVWRINGTQSAVRDTHIPGKHDKCAQVLTVKLRCKYDVIIQSNKLEDFILFHEKFEYPDYVLRDEVSLYHVNQHEAIFVECAPGINPWDLQKYSFSREAQFKQAKKVIIMPIASAHQLASKLANSRDNLIFLGNTSRCGSTLLCRMFQSTGHYISYVEPGVMGDICQLINLEDDANVVKFITTTITLLCKPHLQNPAIEGHVIKVAPPDTKVIENLYQIYPDAHYLFCYRNQIPVMKSLARIVPSMPHTRLVGLLALFSDSHAERFAKYHNRGDDLLEWDETYKSPYKRIFPICLRPTTLYFSFLQHGLHIYAIRFEDLIQDPEGSLQRIFSKCGVPKTYIPKALIPLDRDAQENSALSGARLHGLSIPEFTNADQRQVKKICEHYGLPNVLVDKIYPGTITLSGDLSSKYLRTSREHHYPSQ